MAYKQSRRSEKRRFKGEKFRYRKQGKANHRSLNQLVGDRL